ncbi:MAG: flap endonuclease-1 [Candidatus Aenigmarchaeota archaeon]|nr:flap endonuclease-1 [Candidatus Aenigmarchaeota archaeon]
MGVNLGDITIAHQVQIQDLSGKKIAIDAFNTLYQFITIIRQPDGTPLKDSKGRITSHLSGLFYRTSRLLEAGVKPCFVFDGEPPELKKATIRERAEKRRHARELYEKAIASGNDEEARKYGQISASLNSDIIEESKRLLSFMGVPCVQAPGEGEAQASHMATSGLVWAAASQDYDSLLFGTPILLRNVTVAGRKKLPRKEQYVDVVPETISLSESLEKAGINRKQLVILGLLVGTDFNNGVKGIGPKKALDLVKKYGDDALKHVEWDDPDISVLMDIFEKHPVEDVKSLEWGSFNHDALIRLMCEEHDFSEERINSAIEKVEKSGRGKQKSLGSFFGK